MTSRVVQRAEVPGPDEAEVVTKAVRRAAKRLGLNDAELARVLGVSPSTVSRLDERPLARAKARELALLLIRVYRSLVGIVGSGDGPRRWMATDNAYLGARPVELVQQVEGLTGTLRYLDAMRART
ncbi:MAG: antitoxin Xre-like helix-turn-helix domain-containing protein [Myxococcota bacterium]